LGAPFPVAGLKVPSTRLRERDIIICVANFHINLGNFRPSSGERETIVEFICNAEELQSLINRLKEIERHCHHMAVA